MMDTDRIFQVVDATGFICAQVHSMEEAKREMKWRLTSSYARDYPGIHIRALDDTDTHVIGYAIEGVPSMPDDDDGIESGFSFTVE